MHEPHKTRKAIMKLHLILNIISVSGKLASFPTKTGAFDVGMHDCRGTGGEALLTKFQDEIKLKS